jgi:hypothetical protein
LRHVFEETDAGIEARCALGSTAFINLKRELTRRLAEIEGQRDVAFSADRDAVVAAATDPSGT